MLHATVLEPDFDLTFGKIERSGDLDATRSAQVLVEVELFLQLQQLRVGVGRSQTSWKTFVDCNYYFKCR